MKKFIYATFLMVSIVVFTTGCSGYGETEKITDSDVLSEINQVIVHGMEEYFQIIVKDDDYTFEAFKSYIPNEDGSMLHLNNIFQSELSSDPIVGQLSSYGGILTPDNKDICGLILNVYQDSDTPISVTVEDAEQIALDFLNDSSLVPAGEITSYTGQNNNASNEYISIINFSSETTAFAVGVSLQTGDITYFEHAPLALVQQANP